MAFYHIIGQDFYFPCQVTELDSFERKDRAADEAALFVPPSFLGNELISRTEGCVGGKQRNVEIYGDTASGSMLLKVEGSGEFFSSPHGEAIGKSDCPSSRTTQSDLQKLDREILLGPVIVLALALRSVWCLHASAAMYKENVIVFLGESGQGKTTLAAYLDSTNWDRVADDILPATLDVSRVQV